MGTNITVREIVDLLINAKTIHLCYGISAKEFNKDSELEMSAYGDFIVGGVESINDGVYEISIVSVPLKRGIHIGKNE